MEERAMADREKLIELLNEMQDSGIVETTAGFSFTKKYIENERIADNLIDNGVTVQELFPASEPPKKNGKYLCRYVFSENHDYPFWQVLHYFATDKNPHFQHEGDLGLKVTHWMPLPQLPKGE